MDARTHHPSGRLLLTTKGARVDLVRYTSFAWCNWWVLNTPEAGLTLYACACMPWRLESYFCCLLGNDGKSSSCSSSRDWMISWSGSAYMYPADLIIHCTQLSYCSSVQQYQAWSLGICGGIVLETSWDGEWGHVHHAEVYFGADSVANESKVSTNAIVYGLNTIIYGLNPIVYGLNPIVYGLNCCNHMSNCHKCWADYTRREVNVVHCQGQGLCM